MSNNSTYNPNIHHRRSIRLKGYDYAQAGLYFITICCQYRKCLFGEVAVVTVGANNHSPNTTPQNPPSISHSPKMILNDAGKIAVQCWLEIPQHFPNVILHEYIVMPNHIHGIIELITDHNFVHDEIRANDDSPRQMQLFKSPSKTIGSIVRGFKIGVTKWIRNHNAGKFPPQQPVWQRNYYEHIIRNEQAYQRISDYIINNPAKWAKDKFNTE